MARSKPALTDLPDYRMLYHAVILADEVAEMAFAIPREERAWRQAYRAQHRLGWLEFLEVLWRLRDARNVDDAVRAAGTVMLANAFIKTLAESDCLSVSTGGEFAWTSRLFPALGEPYAAQEGCLVPLPEYGQLVASPESSVRRVTEMLRPLPPFGRTVLFLGDDDLTSLYLAARLPGDIVVADIDNRVLERVSAFESRSSSSLRAVLYDVMTPLPAGLTGAFDYVHCDPVDEGFWLAAWLECAVRALSAEVGARFFLNISPRRLGNRLPGLHRYLLQYGLLLERQIVNCSRYALAQSTDPFYVASPPGAVSVYTDLLIFRRWVSAWPLEPRDFRELRRAR